MADEQLDISLNPLLKDSTVSVHVNPENAGSTTALPWNTSLRKMREEYIMQNCKLTTESIIEGEDILAAMLSDDMALVRRGYFSARKIIASRNGGRVCYTDDIGHLDLALYNNYALYERIISLLASPALDRVLLYDVLLLLVDISNNYHRALLEDLPYELADLLLSSFIPGDDPILVGLAVTVFAQLTEMDKYRIVDDMSNIALLTKVAHRFPLKDIHSSIIFYLYAGVVNGAFFQNDESVVELCTYMLQHIDDDIFAIFMKFMDESEYIARSEVFDIRYLPYLTRGLTLTSQDCVEDVALYVSMIAEEIPEIILPELLKVPFIENAFEAIESNFAVDDYFKLRDCLMYCASANANFAKALLEHPLSAKIFVKWLKNTYSPHYKQQPKTHDEVCLFIQDSLTTIGIPFLEALMDTSLFLKLPLFREYDYTQFLEIVHTMLTISREHPVHHEAVLRLAKENHFDEWFDAMARGFERYEDIYKKLSVYFPKPIADWDIEKENESQDIEMDTSIHADEPATKKSNTTAAQ